MRVIFGLCILAIAFLMIRHKALRIMRHLRGLPEPEPQGPKTSTLIVIAIIVVYALLLSYRIFTGNTLMH